MPVPITATVWTKALFDLAYDYNAEPEGHPNTRGFIHLHYNRYILYPEAMRRARFFVETFGLTPQDKVLVIGCGFGWTCEALNNLGIPSQGTDTSTYINTNKALSEDAEIAAAILAVGLDYTVGEGLVAFNRLRGDGVRTRAVIHDEDSSSNLSRTRVKLAFGTPTVVITEDLLTSLSDAECTALRAALVQYGASRIIHFVTPEANPNPPFNFNSKTLADWKALLPDDTFVGDGYSYEVL